MDRGKGAALRVLGPGPRFPTTIRIEGSDDGHGFLGQELVRTAHTALVVGGAGADTTDLSGLTALVDDAVDTELVECSGATCLADSDAPWARLGADGCQLLGVEGLTLFVVRP